VQSSRLIAVAPDDVESGVDCYNSTLRALLDKHDPMKIKRVTDGHRRLAGTTVIVTISSVEPGNWSEVSIGCILSCQRQPGASSLKRSFVESGKHATSTTITSTMHLGKTVS